LLVFKKVNKNETAIKLNSINVTNFLYFLYFSKIFLFRLPKKYDKCDKGHIQTVLF